MKHGDKILKGWAAMIIAAVVAAILAARPRTVSAPGREDSQQG